MYNSIESIKDVNSLYKYFRQIKKQKQIPDWMKYEDINFNNISNNIEYIIEMLIQKNTKLEYYVSHNNVKMDDVINNINNILK
jgi:hypothetical protein